MTNHFIDLEEDFLAVQEYAKENGYRTILPTSKAISLLKVNPCPNSLDFSFEDHETFTIRFTDKRLQQVASDWLRQFIPVDSLERLIFGKDTTQRVVAAEAEGHVLELFIQDEAGNITSKILNNNMFLLSGYKHDSDWHKLEGNQFYKYIKYYQDKFQWEDDKNHYRKYNINIIYNTVEQAMLLQGFTYYKGMKLDELGTLAFDIESTTLHHTMDSKVLLISNCFRKNGVVVRKLFAYDEYKSQGAMLTAWCDWVREMDPSVVIGHNCFNFDLPYLQFVADVENVRLNLGRNDEPLHINDYESRFRKDGSQFYKYKKASIYGRDIIDTMFLAYKYDVGRKYDSYGLKKIIEQEGLEAKDRVFYDAGKIKDNYKNPEEWEKIKRYCEFDADDASNLFYLMIPSFFYYAQSIPKRMQEIITSATGGQLNGFLIRSYLQEGHSIPRPSEAKQYEGAISFGNHGNYFNVLKVDVSSLYPSIILQYELYDRFKDPNGNFLKMVDYFTTERLKNKQLAKETGDNYFKDLQESQKITINSSYGLCGSGGTNNFNSPSIAEFITKKGREVLNLSIEWATKTHDFKIVNADTDSISFCKSDMSIITPEEQQALIDEINALLPEKIKMAHDGYYPNVIVVKAKNYILRDATGKIKIKGAALKGSTKSKALQKYIKEIIDLLLDNKEAEIVDLYHNYIREIHKMTDITPWCSKKTISAKILDPQRTNEQNIHDALDGEEEDYQEGDKIYTYFTEDGTLKLGENWNKDNPDHDKFKLMESLWKTTKIFETVLDISQFEKYYLKTKRKLLVNIL